MYKGIGPILIILKAEDARYGTENPKKLTER
jgi:hypothetical protein